MLLAEPIKRVPVADPRLYDTPEPAYKTLMTVVNHCRGRKRRL